MSSTCWASVRGCAMRVTKLDNCCAPQNDPCAIVVTDGFISAVVTQEVEAAQEIVVKNACDKICVYDPGCDSLKDLTVVLTLCKVNPELIGIMTGQAVVLDSAGVAVGTRRSTDLACDRRFAIEIWTTIPNQACTGGAAAKKNYGYFLLPCVRAATITGDITIDGANAISVELTAKTTVPSLWGSGPENGTSPLANYDVVPIDVAGTPGHLLVPIGNTDHDHMQLTNVPPPSIPSDCGCVALDGQVLPNPGISTVSPNKWAVAGGTAAVINGSGFTGATSVQLIPVASPGTPPVVVPFVVTNDSKITVAASPAAPAGTYHLVVTGPGGKADTEITVA